MNEFVIIGTFATNDIVLGEDLFVRNGYVYGPVYPKNKVPRFIESDKRKDNIVIRVYLR